MLFLKRLAFPALLAVGIAGCGSKSAQQLNANPQVQKDEKSAQQIVQQCVSKGNFLTHGGRQAIIKCIAPPGHEVAFEKCAEGSLAKGFLTPGQRQRLYQSLAVCAENNR